MDRRLPCRVHLSAGLDDIAHSYGLDLVGLEPGALDGRFDRCGAEIGGRDFFEASAEGPDCRSGRVCEDN
jgi:hypothetical protein